MKISNCIWENDLNKKQYGVNEQITKAISNYYISRSDNLKEILK